MRISPPNVNNSVFDWALRAVEAPLTVLAPNTGCLQAGYSSADYSKVEKALTDGPSEVISALRDHPNHNRVQYIGSWALHILSYQEQDETLNKIPVATTPQELIDLGVLEVLADTFKHNRENPATQKFAMSVVCNLFDQTPSLPDGSMDLSFLSELVESLAALRSFEEVQQCGLLACINAGLAGVHFKKFLVQKTGIVERLAGRKGILAVHKNRAYIISYAWDLVEVLGADDPMAQVPPACAAGRPTTLLFCSVADTVRCRWAAASCPGTLMTQFVGKSCGIGAETMAASPLQWPQPDTTRPTWHLARDWGSR
ncbi:hypothetical protein CYMTET_28790 [Cymbomonas tetramitiformis]|uniref:Uncharacterized protein n=1 Tax=Cymbomonas tetramitiformis TaxID=36881 RepID=A0AAE0KVJ8_9CHLO|nr:hypothetical protein CYMTET_28790 [Cymbomonas tetramitiformis]